MPAKLRRFLIFTFRFLLWTWHRLLQRDEWISGQDIAVKLSEFEWTVVAEKHGLKAYPYYDQPPILILNEESWYTRSQFLRLMGDANILEEEFRSLLSPLRKPRPSPRSRD